MNSILKAATIAKQEGGDGDLALINCQSLRELAIEEM